MELRHLRYFVAVAEHGNFTRAAARMRVAQPALSRQIQALEDEIGVDLFRRSPRGVTLTAEGRLFRADVAEVLSRVDGAVARARALSRGEVGDLNVGYSPTPSAEVLPPALAAFRRESPGVSLHLHELAGNELAEGLKLGRLDMAVMQKPIGSIETGLLFEKLRSYSVCVAMADTHALARRRRISIVDLLDERFVVYRRSEYQDYHEFLRRIWVGQRRRPNIVRECDGGASLAAEVTAGTGVAIVPQVFSITHGRSLRLKPLSDAPERFEVGIVRAALGDFTPAAEKLCRQLRKFAR